MKEKIEQILQWLNPYSNGLQAIFTFVLVLTAVIAIFQTRALLGQQESQNYIEHRAYVYPESQHIEVTNINNIPSVNISMLFRNSGKTPANDLSWRSYILAGGKAVEDIISSSTGTMGPGSSGIFNVLSAKQARFDLLKFSKDPEVKESFVIEYKYKTYSGSCIHEKTFTYVIKSNDGKYFIGPIKQQSIPDTSCQEFEKLE